MRDCGSDDVCNADLVVTASPELPGYVSLYHVNHAVRMS